MPQNATDMEATFHKRVTMYPGGAEPATRNWHNASVELNDVVQFRVPTLVAALCGRVVVIAGPAAGSSAATAGLFLLTVQGMGWSGTGYVELNALYYVQLDWISARLRVEVAPGPGPPGVCRLEAQLDLGTGARYPVLDNAFAFEWHTFHPLNTPPGAGVYARARALLMPGATDEAWAAFLASGEGGPGAALAELVRLRRDGEYNTGKVHAWLHQQSQLRGWSTSTA